MAKKQEIKYKEEIWFADANKKDRARRAVIAKGLEPTKENILVEYKILGGYWKIEKLQLEPEPPKAKAKPKKKKKK